MSIICWAQRAFDNGSGTLSSAADDVRIDKRPQGEGSVGDFESFRFVLERHESPGLNAFQCSLPVW